MGQAPGKTCDGPAPWRPCLPAVAGRPSSGDGPADAVLARGQHRGGGAGPRGGPAAARREEPGAVGAGGGGQAPAPAGATPCPRPGELAAGASVLDAASTGPGGHRPAGGPEPGSGDDRGAAGARGPGGTDQRLGARATGGAATAGRGEGAAWRAGSV